MVKIDHYEAVCAEVIRVLKKEREKQHLTNYAIWRQTGISQSMLGRIERGLRRPTMELMLRVADAVGIDLGKCITKAQAKIRRAAKH